MTPDEAKAKLATMTNSRPFPIVGRMRRVVFQWLERRDLRERKPGVIDWGGVLQAMIWPCIAFSFFAAVCIVAVMIGKAGLL